MENANFVYVKGYEVKPTMLGNYRTGRKVEILTHSDSGGKYFSKGKEKYMMYEPCIVNGNFTLSTQVVDVTEFREMTQAEILQFNQTLEAHNMHYGTIQVERRYTPFLAEPYTVTKELNVLLYKDKGLLEIVINGERQYYKDLDVSALKGKYIVLQGDNGYSHYWSDGISAEKLVDFVERMFQPFKGNNYAFGMGKVHFGDYQGWHFIDGVLIVRMIDEKPKRESVVSNT